MPCRGQSNAPARQACAFDTMCAATLGHTSRVFDESPTAADLLNAWREAVRAAELAERLALLASETASQADVNATTAEEVAVMAEQVAQTAAAASNRARTAADEARRIAQRDREAAGVAEATHERTRAAQIDADEAYQSR